MKNLLIILILTLVASACSHPPSMSGPINSIEVAIRGYDVVAYHMLNEAREGSSHFSSEFGDAEYHFISSEYQSLFDADPQKYLPKYGGYCAIGIAIYDGKYDIEPKDFLFDGGELYLFCPDQIDNWKADQNKLRELAENNWPLLKDKEEKSE